MQIQKYKLANGLSLVCIKRKQSDVTAVKFFIKVGSQDDGEIPGITHFLEHLLFQNKVFFEKIQYEVEKCGGILNASTTREYICVYMVFIKDKFKSLIKLFLDIIFRFALEEVSIENEKRIIEKELIRNNNSANAFWDILMMSYWESGPLRMPILGFAEYLEKITYDNIIRHYKEFFHFGNMVLTVCGNIEMETVVKEVETYLNPEINNCFISREHKRLYNNRLNPQQRIIINKSVSCDHLFIVYKIPDFTYSRNYLFKLIRQKLTEGNFSLLFTELRRKRGLVYSVESNPLCFLSDGIFMIYVKVYNDKLNGVEEIIYNEIEKLQSYQYPADELDFLKSQYTGGLVRKFETNLSVASIVGIEELLLGYHIPFDVLNRQIQEVSAMDLQTTVNNYFHSPKVIIISAAKNEDI